MGGDCPTHRLLRVTADEDHEGATGTAKQENTGYMETDAATEDDENFGYMETEPNNDDF
jgi:hypothetical protein